MIEFESSIEINRPLSDVFQFVADQRNNPKWNYYVTQVKKTSAGSLDVGTTFHQTRKTDAQELQIVAYNPYLSLSIKNIPPSKPEINRTIEFREENGGTILTDYWQLDSGHIYALQKLAKNRVKSAVQKNLLKLKELLETGSTTLQDGRQVSL